MRLVLDYTCKMKLLSWNYETSSWEVISEKPSAHCDLYSSCGTFGYCDHTVPVPKCRCLDGFELVDGGNFSRGCRRKDELKCGEKTHFVTLPWMKVPDKFSRIWNTSFDQCAAECTGNCSCIAYDYSNISNSGRTTDMWSRCLVWTGNLIDTGKAGFPENLYLWLADASGRRSSRSDFSIYKYSQQLAGKLSNLQLDFSSTHDQNPTVQPSSSTSNSSSAFPSSSSS